MKKEEIEYLKEIVTDSLVEQLEKQIEEAEKRKQELENKEKETLKQAIERFDENDRQFICTEAFKIFYKTEDEKIALEALKLLKETVF